MLKLNNNNNSFIYSWHQANIKKGNFERESQHILDVAPANSLETNISKTCQHLLSTRHFSYYYSMCQLI